MPARPRSAIQQRLGDAYLPRVQDALTRVRPLNKTDVLTLLSTFGSVAGVFAATPQQLALCPGFGEKKVKRLLEVLQAPLM